GVITRDQRNMGGRARFDGWPGLATLAIWSRSSIARGSSPDHRCRGSAIRYGQGNTVQSVRVAVLSCHVGRTGREGLSAPPDGWSQPNADAWRLQLECGESLPCDCLFALSVLPAAFNPVSHELLGS